MGVVVFDDWYKLDKNNNVIKANGFSDIGKIFEGDNDRRIVAQDKNEIWFLSTVFLGLDHGRSLFHEMDFISIPVVFETMLFHSENESDLWGRYSTWEQAYNGHMLSLNALNNGTGIEDIKIFINRSLMKESDDENEKEKFDVERDNVVDIRSLV